MGRLFIGGLLVAVTVWCMPSPASAGIFFDSGSLQVAVSASAGTVGDSSTPPDVVIPPSGSADHSASITVNDPNLTASSTSTASTSFDMFFGGFGLQLSGSASVSRFAALNVSGAASYGATVTLTETSFRSYEMFLSGGSVYGGGAVTLKDSLDTTLYTNSVSGGFAQFVDTVSLTPGTYTLTWGGSAHAAAGTGGSASMNFTMVPEPASLALLAIPAAMICRRRPRAFASH